MPGQRSHAPHGEGARGWFGMSMQESQKRILVPLDGSGLAARTVGTAVDMANRLGARVTLLMRYGPSEPDPTRRTGGDEADRHSQVLHIPLPALHIALTSLQRHST